MDGNESQQYLKRLTYGALRLVKEFRSIQDRREDMDRVGIDIMLLLAGRKELRPTELAAELDVNPSSVTRRIKGMVAEGLVAARTDPSDKRSSILSLTPAGSKKLEEYFLTSVEGTGRLLHGWKEAEIRQLSELLWRFCDALQAGRETGERQPD